MKQIIEKYQLKWARRRQKLWDNNDGNTGFVDEEYFQLFLFEVDHFARKRGIAEKDAYLNWRNNGAAQKQFDERSASIPKRKTRKKRSPTTDMIDRGGHIVKIPLGTYNRMKAELGKKGVNAPAQDLVHLESTEGKKRRKNSRMSAS